LLLIRGFTAKPKISDTDYCERIGAATEAHTWFLTWLIPNLNLVGPLQCPEDLDKLSQNEASGTILAALRRGSNCEQIG
jgi:hypothetical protein